MKKQQICILGSTGSIGTQALDVIEQHSDLYEVGYDTRNLLGKGDFEGTFAVDGWETAGEGWLTKVTFPEPHTYTNVWYQNPAGYWVSTRELCALLANRDWSAFVGLLYEHNGPDSAYLNAETCRFLVSGSLPRDEALALAADLTKGTSLEPVFSCR